MHASTRPSHARWLPPLALLSGLMLAGCARAVNLTQPGSPRFDGRYADAAPSEKTAGPIRVVTFNIKLGRFVDRAVDVLREARLAEADLLALQEVDEEDVDRVARALGLDYVYFPAVVHPASGRYFGPALLSRWPIERAWKVLLPHVGSGRQHTRTATAATVLVRGRRIRVYAVHLETQHQLSPAKYRDQAAAILRDAEGSPDPVVLAGDFNGHDIGRYFVAKGFAWPTRDLGRTSTLFSLDHIFARGLAPVDSAAAGVVADVKGASDHRPVWATMMLGPR